MLKSRINFINDQRTSQCLDPVAITLCDALHHIIGVLLGKTLEWSETFREEALVDLFGFLTSGMEYDMVEWGAGLMNM